MQLLFERSHTGRRCTILPACDVAVELPDASLCRAQAPHLPSLSENEISRHYTELAKQTHGVNDGFYPLGSCTMKYNPKVNDEIASLPGFAAIHPLQPQSTAQGCLEVMDLARKYLCEITGMDDMTFQPAAGAHGELTGLMLIKAYHQANGHFERTKILVPDSAHGTNPASATMAGFQVVSIPSLENGCVDLDALRAAADEHTAGLMLTNPNTVGLFDPNIAQITDIIHQAGGLCYYDGANLNAIMGIVRPGDTGFDVVHLNLHKTFSTQHGGGGPGSGAVGCKNILKPFLPSPTVVGEEGALRLEQNNPQSIGAVKAFYGNFLVVVRALTYLMTLGKEGVPEASSNAVLNCNYMMNHLKDVYDIAFDTGCMHEFVMTLANLKKEKGVSAMDVAKGLLDNGIHPPTMYFPLIVEEALMVEPTETEPREVLDHAIAVLHEIYQTAQSDPEKMHQMPLHTPVRRLDEVGAARNPRLRFTF